jgi:hypothetical protein
LSGGPAMLQLSGFAQRLAQELEAAGRAAPADNGISQEGRLD